MCARHRCENLRLQLIPNRDPSTSIPDVDCGAPPSIPNGEIHAPTTHYGALVEYRCHNGFRLSNGAERRLCLENGTWSGSDPACVEVLCPEPPQTDTRLLVEVSYDAVLSPPFSPHFKNSGTSSFPLVSFPLFPRFTLSYCPVCSHSSFPSRALTTRSTW